MKQNVGNVSKINSGFTLISHRLTAATAINYCAIATGNRHIVIRCAEHHPGGSLACDKLKFVCVDRVKKAGYTDRKPILR